MAAAWPDDVDRIIDGDMTAALAYVTPAGGAVVTAVAPIGLRDRARGTVGFTTSLGFGRKLERIHANPKVALAYHAREHGHSDRPLYVLVQGDAEITIEPDEAFLRDVVTPQAERFLGARKTGVFWDRWLREYYLDRVPVTVSVRRMTVWPDLAAAGEPATPVGAPAAGPPAPQRAPHGGTG